MIALDAVDRDGHLLVVLVDGDGDFGLGGAAGEQHQAGDGNEEGTHFTFGLQACLRSAGSPSPASLCPETGLVPVACRPSLIARAAQARREAGWAAALTFSRAAAYGALEFVTEAQPFGRRTFHTPGLTASLPPSSGNSDEQDQDQDRGAAGRPSHPAAASRPPPSCSRYCDPHAGHAQGIVRGAQEGTYEGNRIAGPVGGVVGGAVGAGVGGAMGAVKGVLGIPIAAASRPSLPRLLQQLRPFPLLSLSVSGCDARIRPVRRDPGCAGSCRADALRQFFSR